jgi:hypothetical protein
MKIRVRVDSDNARARLRRWGGEFTKRARSAAARALREEAPKVAEAVRTHVAERLKIARRGFLKSFRAKVYDRNPQKLPALWIGSNVPWVGIHERGGAIQGPLLIPLHGRVGRKRFKQIVTALIRGGNAYFVKVNGRVLLMAENIGEHDRLLAGFKRRYRKASGAKRLRRGQDVPIAVLMPRVAIARRINVIAVSVRALPRLASEVEHILLSTQ